VGSSWCPRCGLELVAPSVYDSAWRCGRHGQVLPLSVFDRVDEAAISHIREHAEVPLWLPDPMPAGWRLCGLAAVGDGRSRLRATVAACAGPAPLGGDGEWLLIAEEPGIGLGAGYAGMAASALAATQNSGPAARISAAGRPLPLWPVATPGLDRSAYAGEAAGVWLWLVSFPADAGYAVLEDLTVTDVGYRHILASLSQTHSHRLRPGH
jgi:hypothetical protein